MLHSNKACDIVEDIVYDVICDATYDVVCDVAVKKKIVPSGGCAGKTVKTKRKTYI